MERKNSRSRVVRRGTKRHAAIVLGLLGSAGLAACGRSDVLYKDDQYGAHGARGGSGGTGAHTTGGTNFTGGTGGGGTSSGGTGGTPGKGGGFGTGATGGTGGTGGSFGTGGTVITGGSSGRAGAGGSGGVAGAAGKSGGPYACLMPTRPTCDTFTNFSTDQSITWGNGVFTGGVAVFGNGITRDTATSQIHVTGKVSDYSNGIIIYFATCADLSDYAGVYFTIAGTTGFNDEIQLMPWTNSDYPWQEDPSRHVGACTSSNPMSPFVDCMSPEVLASLYSGRQYAYWSDFSGGSPVGWNSNVSPGEIVGIQWLFPYDPGFGAYAVDVTLDDVGFIRSGIAAPDCGPAIGTGGMGGMGGTSGMAGMSGMAGVGGTAGFGGFAGSAGTSTGGAGAGGIGGFNAGGSSTGGFSAGGFSAGGFSAGGMAGDLSAGGFSAGGVAGDFSGGGFFGAGQSAGGMSTGGQATGGQDTSGIGGS